MEALDHVISKHRQAALVVTASRPVALEDTPPANGTTILAPTFVSTGFGRITGTCRSDVALTLKIYQGSTPTTMDVVTSVAVPANANEGMGVGFTVEVIGEYSRIDVINAGAAGAAFSFCSRLRGV